MSKSKKVIIFVLVCICLFFFCFNSFFAINIGYYCITREKAVYVTNNEAVEMFGYKDKNTADYSIEEFLGNIQKHHINKVYIYLIEDGISLYNTEILTNRDFVDTNQENEYDFLQSLITRAHKKNIYVYGCISPYNFGKDNQDNFEELKENEDYYIFEENYYLVPTSFKAQNYVINIVKEIVNRYKFDGLLFDETCYPQDLLMYDDILQPFENASYDKYKIIYKQDIDYKTWRKDSISSLLKSIRELLHDKGKQLNVMIDYIKQNNEELYMDYDKWLNGYGYVDNVVFDLKNFDLDVNSFRILMNNLAIMNYTTIANIEIKLYLDKQIINIIQQRSICTKRFLNYGYSSYSYFKLSYYDPSLYNMQIVEKNINLL